MQGTKTANATGVAYILEILKTLVVAIIITLGLILISSLIIKLFNIPTEYIIIIVQIIKSVSIFVSALVCFKLPHNGWVRGIIFGIIYILLAFLIFSLFNREFVLNINLLNDVALGAVSGLISGIIAVNFKKNKYSA